MQYKLDILKNLFIGIPDNRTNELVSEIIQGNYSTITEEELDIINTNSTKVFKKLNTNVVNKLNINNVTKSVLYLAARVNTTEYLKILK